MIPLGLWHCFGHRFEIVDHDTACRMLDASGTRLLPLNTNTGRLLVGHGDVTWDSFQDEADARGLVPCLNINLQTSAASAVAQAVRFRDVSGIGLLKLEVLTPDLNDSNDSACLDATLMLADAGFQVMPLFKNAWAVGISHDHPHVPVVRLMGSPIGSGQGIVSPDDVRAACSYGTPVILDGGIGTLEHAQEALELGCHGFLVNSCLFKHHSGPVAALEEFATVEIGAVA